MRLGTPGLFVGAAIAGVVGLPSPWVRTAAMKAGEGNVLLFAYDLRIVGRDLCSRSQSSPSQAPHAVIIEVDLGALQFWICPAHECGDGRVSHVRIDDHRRVLLPVGGEHRQSVASSQLSWCCAQLPSSAWVVYGTCKGHGRAGWWA